MGTKGHQCGDKLPSPSKTSSKHTKPPLLLLPSGKRPSSRTRYLLIKARGRLAFSGVSINQSLGNLHITPLHSCPPNSTATQHQSDAQHRQTAASQGNSTAYHLRVLVPHHPCIRFLSQTARDQSLPDRRRDELRKRKRPWRKQVHNIVLDVSEIQSGQFRGATGCSTSRAVR